MLKRRNRIINFRVTEDEFTRLRDASIENGARCLSDFARTAILIGLEGFHRHAPSEEHGKDELQSLVQRLGTMERNIAKLEKIISRFTPDERKEMRAEVSV